MNINKKHVMAGMIASALVIPMADINDVHADEVMQTTARVNFRKGPGTNYSSMYVIGKGEKVTCLETNGSWIKAVHNSKTGYIHKDYVSGISSDSNTGSTTVKYVKANGGLNVRKGPSTSYAKIGKLANGSKVNVIATSGGWSKINYGSTVGYVSNDYLVNEGHTNNEPTAGTTKYVKANGGLNVRKGPSTSYAKVGKLANGSQVKVISTSNGWSKIESGNINGYVSDQYLTANKPSTGGSDNTGTDNTGSNNVGSDASTSNQASQVVSFARAQKGKKYSWGAQGPNSFDCSGFTYYVYKNSVGITLPRVSSSQGNAGVAVSKSNLQPGDLVFFDTSGPNNGVITHVGIYAGNNMLIHASSGKGVVVETSMATSYWQNAFVKARRVL
ncbi:C40 family peptidase [Terrisporobacter sp.]|uniref:C40 family peptidase n=1 Tax=Terrisporobacter sp. TaxID=1965305 RepID=UPI0026180B37|nr:C40 family peptidase [Terrisporobacter sp.]